MRIAFTRSEKRGEEQRVAIGRGSRHRLGRDDGVGSHPVLDDEGLAKRLGHVLRDDARDQRRSAARREADQDLHGLSRDSSARCSAGKRTRCRRGESRECFFHRSSRVSGMEHGRHHLAALDESMLVGP